MTIITKYPARLNKLIDHVSQKFNKPFKIIATRILGDSEAGLSLVERHKKYDVIPIYLSQVPNYVNNNNDLTPLGEHLAAHEIGHFMVYNEGYGKMNINMLGMDPDALNNLGKDLANIVPLLLPGYFSGIFNFASHLIVNNRLAAYGYDASGEMYNVLYDKNINSLRETLSEQQMDAFGARYEINLRDNPDAARILFFEGTRMLSEMYLFLPQPYKGELLESVGEFWKNQVISLLKETETDLDRSRLYSPNLINIIHQKDISKQL